MIDFEIPEDAKIIRETVRKFVREHCIPRKRVSQQIHSTKSWQPCG